MASSSTGYITQVVGPVVDVHFTLEGGGDLPRIHEALSVKRENGRTLIIEVQQHIGEDTVRCVAMDSTDGLSRGMEARATGNPIAMPVGAQIRGRVMNVVGDTIDGMGELSRDEALPIHREAPKFDDLDAREQDFLRGGEVLEFRGFAVDRKRLVAGEFAHPVDGVADDVHHAAADLR
ncbi:MAG: hypothetical protein IKD95_01175, partial [Bacteroidales bacterium]|nr:hypothetical protein [Bacteroidales bacterium]